MTKKQHREGLRDNLRVLWNDPYVRRTYAREMHCMASIMRDMHNRRLNPRRPDWARRMTPGLRAQLAHEYFTTDLATEQIAQMYDVNQSRVSEAVIGVRT